MLILGLLEIPLWLIIILAIAVLLYYRGTKNHDYFKKMGIQGPTPYPFLGTLWLFFKYDLYTMHIALQQKYGKVVGVFSGTTPEYVIYDEEMISQVTVKQFQNFSDRRPSKFDNPAFDNMVSVLEGDHWKSVRSQMSPAFTTGKLRLMASEINRGGNTFAKKLANMGGPFEARDCAGAFTMDVIASSAFGLRMDTQEDENNKFLKYGKKMTNFDTSSGLFLLFFLCPSLLKYLDKYLGITMIDRGSVNFFMSFVEKSLKNRKDMSDTSRVDFLQLMVKAQEGHDIHDKEEDQNKDESKTTHVGMSKEEILANALLFFFAGYDTTAAGLSTLMYLLATNQDAQKKLIDEIDEVMGDKEELDYDSAGKLHYLHQCIQESLRIYPPGVLVDRIAKVDTEVCGVKIEKDTIVSIPIMAIHRDPEIWPEPEKFDPERFSPENKTTISPVHWMPFGYGPRHCIAMRLALFEIKVAIVNLLKSHRLVTCEKTEIPLKLSKNKLMKPENGIWLEVEKR